MHRLLRVSPGLTPLLLAACSLLLTACTLPSQECPINATWTDQTCACDAGLFGEISWDADAEIYTGECITAVEMAVRTGDASYVDAAGPILDEARLALDDAAGTWTTLLRSIYDDGPVEYTPGNSSQFVRANSLEDNTALVLGSLDGEPLAAIGQLDGARYAAFGFELLSSFADGGNADFERPFERTLAWMLRDDAGAGLPVAAAVAVVGMGGAEGNAVAWAEGLGWTAEICSPDSYDDCFAAADLLVVGSAGGDADVDAFQRAYFDALDAGVEVLFVHTGTWGTSNFGAAALSPLDLSFGGYGGNYWANDYADWSSISDMLAGGGSIAALRALVEHFVAGDYDFDWSQCTEFVGQRSCGDVPGFADQFLDGARAVKDALAGLDGQGVAMFTEDGRRIWKLMTLLGDVFRRDIAYPMDRLTTDTMEFLAAYYADHSVHYGRAIQAPQEDMGSFSSGEERDVQPSPSEELAVSVSRRGGFTAVGAYVLPGEVVTIERTDGEDVAAWVSINTQRTGSTREFDNDGYTRPKYLQSPRVPVVAGVPVSFSSPYGGTLQLHASGSDLDRELFLQVDGAGRHEVFELGEDTAAYADALASSPYPFTEIRNPYVQIHSLRSRMLESIDNYGGDLDLFTEELERYMIQDTYNLAGFVGDGLEQSATVLAHCDTLGWSCTDADAHAKPPIQHINVDLYAHCGGGCSGNPYDQAWALGPLGWGETHEIGHNLQRGRIKIYGGRSNEVSNQIFPLHKHVTWAEDTGESLSADRSDYRFIFDLLQEASDDADPTATVYDAIWAADGTYSNNGDRMNFYLQLAHRSDDVAWLDSGWDVYTLMYLQDRLVADALADEDTWDAQKEALGFGTYADRPELDGNDFMLLSMSFLTERDQRPFFAMFGVTWSSSADLQMDAYGFTEEPRTFWASTDTNQAPHPEPVLIDGTSAWPL
ncbi:MAG: ImpA family metalloprotease [Deltaproteobacteria bacterium]|nr:ImpA family metalloprotease [Deltaproteobacteria bacterium]